MAIARRLVQRGIPSFVLSMIIISSVRRRLHDFVPIGTIYNHSLFFPFPFASSFPSNTNKFVGLRSNIFYPYKFIIEKIELGISQTRNLGLSWSISLTWVYLGSISLGVRRNEWWW